MKMKPWSGGVSILRSFGSGEEPKFRDIQVAWGYKMVI